MNVQTQPLRCARAATPTGWRTMTSDAPPLMHMGTTPAGTGSSRRIEAKFQPISVVAMHKIGNHIGLLILGIHAHQRETLAHIFGIAAYLSNTPVMRLDMVMRPSAYV